MAQLAIKGHEKRGNEVIEILKILGGHNNSHHFSGRTEYNYYYIGKYNTISCTPKEKIDSSFVTFTLEEFLEKFPYKVGNKINYIKYNDEYPNVYTIQRMRWTGATIEYLLDSNGFSALTKDLQPYKEETMTEITIDIPKGYEFAGIDDNRQQVVFTKIQPEYPTTYEECFNICFGNKHHIVQVVGLDGLGNNKELFESFIKLKICRDAYWKLAGEQMGLGKPWEPDWLNPDVDLYVIINIYNRVDKANYGYGFQQCIFVFPTAEMRDAFLENFKEKLEICKELL